jgi:D-alanyl-D-alanine carboxypeptidase/D-alanyl-D-alanine-endopeptidase (penicillin-binding protein 4)
MRRPTLAGLLLAMALVPVLSSAQLVGRMEDNREQELAEMVSKSPVFAKGFTGFTLYDPTTQAYLHSQHADMFFTPASNTKILTLLASVKVLSNGMPLVFYVSSRDTLWCWGTGYPMLLHPDFQGVDVLLDWLKARPEGTIVLSDAHFMTPRFGEGWSWDDYVAGYQYDRADFPIYGNRVVWKKGVSNLPTAIPRYFDQTLVYRQEINGNTPVIDREETANVFYFGQGAVNKSALWEKVPFHYSVQLAAQLLSDTLQRNVISSRRPLPRKGQYEVVRQPVPDTLYRKMMQSSDNFLAEQLLLMASAERYGIISIDRILTYATDTLLRNLPAATAWVDGSGLSRYNQLTPRGLTQVLEQLNQQLDPELLRSLFAIGGRAGTIRNIYAGPGGKPFVYAKTGTLRNVHCLSGYVLTQTNRLLIFTFMHNNFPQPIDELKLEMNRILRWIHDAY